MFDVLATAFATIIGAAIGGLIPVYASRRQAQLNLITSSFSRVFEEYSRFFDSPDPRNPWPILGAIEQARMLCGKRRFRSCDAALKNLEEYIPVHPIDVERCGNLYKAFREEAQRQLKRLI